MKIFNAEKNEDGEIVKFDTIYDKKIEVKDGKAHCIKAPEGHIFLGTYKMKCRDVYEIVNHRTITHEDLKVLCESHNKALNKG